MLRRGTCSVSPGCAPVTGNIKELNKIHISRDRVKKFLAFLLIFFLNRFVCGVDSISYTKKGKPALLIAMRDITEYKLLDLELEAQREHLKKENIALRSSIKERYKFGEIIGKSPAMQKIYELIAHAAATDVNVLISGESGTGKELVAQTIHVLSDRKEGTLVPVNCGAVPEVLFESEFFGYRKGAFTGADRDKACYFDQAHQGTLFLDEVAELSPLMQVKLLRAIDQGEYMPLGSSAPKKVDVRIIAATNQDLRVQLQQEALRKDFFYRINVVAITVPPLQNHKGALPLLVDHILDQYNHPKQPSHLPPEILQALYRYDWPPETSVNCKTYCGAI